MVDLVQVLTAVGGLLNLLAFIIALHCVISILSFAGTRSSSFNIYVVAVLLPDVIVNLCNAITAGLLVQDHLVYYLDLCIQRNVIILFNFFSNLYLNAVLARETYEMMVSSFKRKKTNGPSLQKALVQSVIVYILSLSYSLWAALEIPSSPFHIASIADCQFLPGSPDGSETEGSSSSWFSPISAGILHGCVFMPPLIYVLYVCIVVKKRQLMPIEGRTRAVALYFFRIAVVFFCFYFPILLLGFISFFFVDESTDDRQSRLAGFWLPWSVTQLMLIQLLVTVRMVLEKDDIREAVFKNDAFILRGISALTKGLYYCSCCGKKNKIESSNSEVNPNNSNRQHDHQLSNESQGMSRTAEAVSKWDQGDVFETRDGDHQDRDIEASTERDISHKNPPVDEELPPTSASCQQGEGELQHKVETTETKINGRTSSTRRVEMDGSIT